MKDNKNDGKKIIIQDGDLDEEIISEKAGKSGDAEAGKTAGKDKASGSAGDNKNQGEANAGTGEGQPEKAGGSGAGSEAGTGKNAGSEPKKEPKDPEGEELQNDNDNEAADVTDAEETADTHEDGSGETESGDGEDSSGETEGEVLSDVKDKRDTIIADLKDRFQRQLAEFENFRKRTEKEKDGMFEAGSRSVIEKILPVVDNFERALENPPEDEASKAFTEGIQMIYKQLMQELEKLGTQPIEAVGKPFDPNLHNAVMQVESEEYESGTVAQELQKGYTYHGTVVRHSMVSVVE